MSREKGGKAGMHLRIRVLSIVRSFFTLNKNYGSRKTRPRIAFEGLSWGKNLCCLFETVKNRMMHFLLPNPRTSGYARRYKENPVLEPTKLISSF